MCGRRGSKDILQKSGTGFTTQKQSQKATAYSKEKKILNKKLLQKEPECQRTKHECLLVVLEVLCMYYLGHA